MTCKTCRTEYQSYKKGGFCSQSCYWQSLKTENVTRVCLTCSEEFLPKEKKVKKAQKYCSRSCSGKANPIHPLVEKKTYTCACGLVFSDYASINRVFCSLKCSYEGLIGKNVGEKSPVFKGGYENQLRLARERRLRIKIGGIHTPREWEDLKRKYNYMCLCCKQQEPFIKLTRDHIVPLVVGGSNSIENIQPLCRSCNSKKYTSTVDYTSVINTSI